MNDTERKQIKPQLLKCAKENENKGTFTGYVIVSSVCRAAVERIEELEADIKLLEQRGSDILKELLDKNKRCMELEQQIEKLIDFVLSKTECCDVCPETDTCINSEGTCPYAGILVKGEEEVTRKWLMQFISGK